MGLEISGDWQIVALQLVEDRTNVSVSGRNSPRRLHDQCRRIGAIQLAESYEDAGGFPVGRSGFETFMAQLAERREKMDNADSELEFGVESTGDHF